MAKLNKERIVRTAEKYIRSGRPDAAVKEYEKWIAANPNDRNIVHKAADLYARAGNKDEAIKKYSQLADYYRADGFNVRAIATYKMILRLDPQDARTMEGLAELQEAQGLIVEAKSQYQTLVELYSKSGKKKRVADVFKKLAELDPTDLRVRYRFAEFLDRDGRIDEAVAEYIGIAEECINMGLVTEAMKILEKGLHVDASNRSLRLKLAHASVLQGDYARAIELLNEVRAKSQNDTEIMTLLGDAYVGAGRLDDAEKMFARLLELGPENPEYACRMADLAIGRGDFGKALERIRPSVDAYVAQGNSERSEALLQKILNKEPHHIETLVKLAEVHTILQNEHARVSAYDRLCEAYAERGNYEKAVHVAKQLVALEPESSQHEDRLRFLESHCGGPAQVGVEIGGLEPEVDSRPTDDKDQAPAEPEGIDSEPIPKLSAEDEENIHDKLTEAEVFARYGLVDKAIDQLTNLLQCYRYHTGIREKLIEVYRDHDLEREASREAAVLAEVYRRLGREDEARRLLEEVGDLEARRDPPDDPREEPAEQEPSDVEIPDVFIEDEELVDDDPDVDWDVAVEEPQPVHEPFTWTDPEGQTIEPARDSGLVLEGGPSDAELQEVNQYVAMGLYEDAKESLRELLGKHPEHPVLLAKIEELGFSVSLLGREDESGAPSMPSSRGFEPESNTSVDLESVLLGELSSTQSAERCGESSGVADEPLSDPRLDLIFREFKKGVEKQVGAEDYDTRYNLGIAYREMGLVDEAIAEFQIAAKGEDLLWECCSMLGLCFMEKCMHEIAIKWFEKGLSLPGREEEAYCGLRYDLACAHERTGNIESALDLFMDIYRVDARFRDVQDRVRALQAARN